MATYTLKAEPAESGKPVKGAVNRPKLLVNIVRMYVGKRPLPILRFS